MKTTLYTKVSDYYDDLLAEIQTAQESISMMYYAFDYGEWSEKISQVLVAKAQSGVKTRLMVDAFGQVLDEPRHSIQNLIKMRALRTAGVQVVLFQPAGRQMTLINRLHCKVCAIDERTVFLGGSNIGEHYLSWRDTNLRLDGDLGDAFHKVYDHVLTFSKGQSDASKSGSNADDIYAGNAHIRLTIPKQQQNIKKALLKLIQDADREIFICTWYFLPDQDITEAILARIEEGVGVNVLLSHKTRVRLIDYANFLVCHQLTKSGVRIIRYTPKYMHAKVAWNDKGDVLFGSANLENIALKHTFECCVLIRDYQLCQELHRAFLEDAQGSLIQTPNVFRQAPLPDKTLSYVCNLATPLL